MPRLTYQLNLYFFFVYSAKMTLVISPLLFEKVPVYDWCSYIVGCRDLPILIENGPWPNPSSNTGHAMYCISEFISCILSLSHAKPFILILLSRQSCMKHWCNQYYCSSTCTIYACENLTSCSSSMHCTIRIINQVKAAFRSRDEWWKKASADKKQHELMFLPAFFLYLTKVSIATVAV